MLCRNSRRAQGACDLQAGPGCRANTPLPVLGKMFRYLAEQSSSPIVCHLDHGYKKEECLQAIDNGFTSVMFDGSSHLMKTLIKQVKSLNWLINKIFPLRGKLDLLVTMMVQSHKAQIQKKRRHLLN